MMTIGDKAQDIVDLGTDESVSYITLNDLKEYLIAINPNDASGFDMAYNTMVEEINDYNNR